MNENNWLMKSLEEASERTKKLPKWALEINAAWEKQYYPQKHDRSSIKGEK
jgi:hypothetical protein